MAREKSKTMGHLTFRVPEEDLVLLTMAQLESGTKRSGLLRQLIRRGCLGILKASKQGQEREVK